MSNIVAQNNSLASLLANVGKPLDFASQMNTGSPGILPQSILDSLANSGNGGSMVRAILTPDAQTLVDTVEPNLPSVGGFRGQILNDRGLMTGFLASVAKHLPAMIHFPDYGRDIKQLHALCAELVRRYQQQGGGGLATMGGGIVDVNQSRRVGARGLVPIVLGAGTLAGTAVTWTVNNFQGLSAFKDCLIFFSDPAGAAVNMTSFAIGTNNRFQIANSAYSNGAVTPIWRYREQHPAFEMGDGFRVGDLTLDNSTSIKITVEVLTGTAAGTQIFATIIGKPSVLPSGYSASDCTCES